MMLREGMFLADRYEIIEQIGTGGWQMYTKPNATSLTDMLQLKL